MSASSYGKSQPSRQDSTDQHLPESTKGDPMAISNIVGKDVSPKPGKKSLPSDKKLSG